MKYESIKLLFQQDKYVQIIGALALVVVGYSLYQMTTAIVKDVDSEQNKAIFQVQTGDVTVMNEIYSGKSWILNKCSAPAGYCWEPLNGIPSKQ
jgi:hypothetical protein